VNGHAISATKRGIFETCVAHLADPQHQLLCSAGLFLSHQDSYWCEVTIKTTLRFAVLNLYLWFSFIGYKSYFILIFRREFVEFTHQYSRG